MVFLIKVNKFRLQTTKTTPDYIFPDGIARLAWCVVFCIFARPIYEKGLG